MPMIAGLTEEQQEPLAAACHERWVIENHRKGITTAVSRITGEEQMVPYEQLSEEIKEYDRMLVRTVLYGLSANGYEVRKR